jgi:AraC-like DNA-binding protein
VTEETIRQALPTATGFAAKQVLVFLQKHNVTLAPLLRRAGLTERDFDSRSSRISAAAQSKLLEYAAEMTGESAFGLHLVQQANPREAGLLFYVASAAGNVGEALGLYERYRRIVNEAVRVKLVRARDGMIAELNFAGLARHEARQNVEFGIAALVNGLQEIAGSNVHPTQVTFAHQRNSDLREFERFFGCPVEFGAPADQLAFSNETLALPLITGDPHLLETLRPFCDGAARERNTLEGTLRAAVENEVQKLLPHGKAKRQIVAKALGMSERTFSRKLTEERTTYDEIIDQLRRSLALQYIKDRSLSFSQIAWLLGYEGPTSFNHAFVRWNGRSPSTARNEKQLSAQPALQLRGR